GNDARQDRQLCIGSERRGVPQSLDLAVRHVGRCRVPGDQGAVPAARGVGPGLRGSGPSRGVSGGFLRSSSLPAGRTFGFPASRRGVAVGKQGLRFITKAKNQGGSFMAKDIYVEFK